MTTSQPITSGEATPADLSEFNYPWDYLAGAKTLRTVLLNQAASEEDADHWRSIPDDCWIQVACLLGLATEQVDSIWGVPGGAHSAIPLS